MKKCLSLIALLCAYLFFPHITFGMLTPSKILKPRASRPITTKIPTATRPRIPTKIDSSTEAPRTTTEILTTPKTTPLSHHILPEEYKSPKFTPEQQTQFEELEKTTKPKVATVIPKTEQEKMFFNNIHKAHNQGKALGFISHKAAEEVKQLGPEYKELFENETNIIKDSNGHPIFKSQKVGLGYEFALPTTQQTATLYSIFGTKEKRNTDFLPKSFPDDNVEVKNFSTNPIYLTDVKTVFEPILANTTAKKAELKKQQQTELLNKAQELAENKARLEKIVEELKTKELEEKQKLLSAQEAEQQAQQELEQTTQIAETKTKELETAEQTTTELQTKTEELIKYEQHATEKAHELAQIQAELNTQAESARQAEINAQAQLEKTQQAEQELIAKLKEAQEAEEKARLEELRTQELKKQEEQKELDTLAEQIAKELAEQELKQFTTEQQRIIEQEQAIEKNIQNLDAEIEILEKEHQQALQNQQQAKTTQEQAIAQQKERDARAEQEQAHKDRIALEQLKQLHEQRLTELKKQQKTQAKQQALQHETEIEKALNTVKQHIAETHYDLEQRQAHHLADLEAQHEQELQEAHETSQEELRLSEQQKQERTTQKQTERDAQQQKQLAEEAELKKEQQDLTNLLEQQKNILHEKIDYQLKSQQELEQQLKQTEEELTIIKTLKTTRKSEQISMQNQLQQEAQALQQNLNQVHSDLEKTEQEFTIAAQESERIKRELLYNQHNEKENNKPEDSLKIESHKEEKLSEEGDDEKKQQTVDIIKPEELTQAPKQSATAEPLPMLPPITTTEIPHLTPTETVIHLTPSTPSTPSTKAQPTASSEPKTSKHSTTPIPQPSTSFPSTPSYQGPQRTGQPTGWPRGTTKIGKTNPWNTNKKTQPYTPPRYGDIWLDPRTPESSSPRYSSSSYSAYPEPKNHEQPITETHPTITIAQQTKPITQTTPRTIEETKEKPTETPEEIAPLDTKKSRPIQKENEKITKPTLNWWWWLLLWIKKQLMIITSYLKNIFAR